MSSDLLRHVLYFGWTGVLLFFIISGFSLAMTMPRHDKTGRPLLSFSMSRLFRIAPVYYLMLALMILLQRFEYRSTFPRSEMVLDGAFLFNFVPGWQTGIVPASWTIGVEMLFYAAFPFLHRVGLRWQALIGIGSMIAFAWMRYTLEDEFSYFFVVGFLPVFLLGMWTFYFYEWLSRTGAAKDRLGIACIACGLGVLLLCMGPTDHGVVVWLRWPIGFGYALILLGCGLRPIPFLSAKPLRLAGALSYSLYLFHAPIIMHLNWHLHVLERFAPGDLGVLASFSAVLALALPLAYASYRMIEMPFNRFGTALIRLTGKYPSILPVTPSGSAA